MTTYRKKEYSRIEAMLMERLHGDNIYYDDRCEFNVPKIWDFNDDPDHQQ